MLLRFSPALTTALRWWILCAALVAQLAPLAQAASAADSVEGLSEQIHQTDTLLKQLQQDIVSSRLQKQKIADSLTAVQGNVSERTHRLKQLNKEIAQYNSKLDSLSSSISEQVRTIDKRKSLLADSLRKSQRVNTASGLKVILQHDDPVLADRLGIYTEYFMAAQDNAIEQQLAALTLIEEAHLEAAKNRNWLNHIKKKAQKQHDNFAANARAQKTELTTVENQLTEKQRSVAQLKADQSRLQILLEELKAAQVAKSGYFLAGKGQYPLPVDGQLQARFGELKSVGKIRWQGLFIAARYATPVGAIADGEVIYSDWLQGFGNLVILDHGDAFMTLYGGNRDVRVKKGDWVDSGSTIATVGNSGGQTANGVYFEIRHNAKPVDPAAWVDTSISINSAGK
ncbi:MAG: peptidoglycan DD-metalloendopeptidase family protein [Granulosicoccaceae bacterium]